MLLPKYKIKVLYSTIEYDVIFGIIVSTESQCSLYKINDRVFVFVTWNEHLLGSMYTLEVYETSIFRFSEERNNTPCKLPLLKYGCLAIYINEQCSKYKLEKVKLHSTFNVYNCLKNIVHSKIEWYDLSNKDCKSHKKDFKIVITPSQWYIELNHVKKMFDLDKKSLLQEFGENLIYILVKYIEKYSLKTNIYYIEMNDLLIVKSSKSRFFCILDFCQNSNL
jgi:hypothetical protein